MPHAWEIVGGRDPESTADGLLTRLVNTTIAEVIDQTEISETRGELFRGLPQMGFAVLENFVNSATVQQLIAAVESLPPDSESSRTRKGTEFGRRNLLELQFVRDLIALPCVEDIVNEIAPGSKAVRAILFDKTGSANWTVPWHQDRSIAVQERIDVPGFGPWSKKAGVAHVQPPLSVLKEMITLRIQLDPCGAENGPLRVIAETHDRILTQYEIEESVREQKQIACTTSAGGLIVMRPLVLHASSPAIQPSHRRVIHVEFGPPALPGGFKWAQSVG